MPFVEEKHYSPTELGEILSLSHDTIIKMFRDEADVVVIERPHKRGTRVRKTYRIPRSVVERVVARNQNG